MKSTIAVAALISTLASATSIEMLEGLGSMGLSLSQLDLLN